jgi:CRISPR-associated protein Cas1
MIIKRDDEVLDTIPVEDIGVLILDHYGVTISHYLLAKLLENNVAVITCNDIHQPNGMFLNLDGNTVQTEKFKAQLEASEPFKKQLWAQTVSAKIFNQAEMLRRKNIPAENMLRWSKTVTSGDSKNLEARAAAFYWKAIFADNLDFYRSRMGPPPNNLLNYGYAILRAIIARSLVGSGLLPTLGIHHRNKYNAYCLADDIMEPYRPFVDEIVNNITDNGEDFTELSPSVKKQLLEIATADVLIDDERKPLMIASQSTSASLVRCFEGKARKISYPEFVPELILKKKRKKY